MILEKLSLINYKNIQTATLELSPKINCFIGQNGVGKTNVLDAIYYLSFCGILDDQKVVDENRDRITDMLTQSVRESTGLRNFIEAGFKFEYVCHSEKEPKKVLFRIVI